MNKFLLFFSVVLVLTSFSSQAQTPLFSLRNLDDELVHLEEYLGKQPIILDFWATWCKPCLKNLPKLEKIYQDYAPQGLVVLAINEDGTRSLSKVEPMANSLGLTFPILIDENREVMRKYRVSGLPTTLLIDQQKEIVFTLRGYRPGDEETLRNEIQALLAGDEK